MLRCECTVTLDMFVMFYEYLDTLILKYRAIGPEYEYTSHSVPSYYTVPSYIQIAPKSRCYSGFNGEGNIVVE